MLSKTPVVMMDGLRCKDAKPSSVVYRDRDFILGIYAFESGQRKKFGD